MSTPPAIPPAYGTLVDCLRSAVNATSYTPPADTDWASLFAQARQQHVDAFLYPWLATRVPDLFSARAAPGDTPAANWRMRFLATLAQTTRRQQQLAELLSACADARIDVLPLKGAALSESVYDDPAQRTMCDLDLLVRAADCSACHRLFLSLGYAVKTVTLGNPYSSDQAYYHPSYPWFVELHWHVASRRLPDTPIPDLDAIWQNTSEAVCCGQPVRALAAEDQLGHLVQHMVHHLFAVPMRSYLDIALFLRKHGEHLTPDRLAAASRRWKTGRGLPFVLQVVTFLFRLPPPAAIREQVRLTDEDAERYAQALQTLCALPEAPARSAETTLLRFRDASPLGRLRLVLSRIFMPRAFLIPQYPCARHVCGLPLAWLQRARDLRRLHRRRIRALFDPVTQESRGLASTERRLALVRWLLEPRGPSDG